MPTVNVRYMVDVDDPRKLTSAERSGNTEEKWR